MRPVLLLAVLPLALQALSARAGARRPRRANPKVQAMKPTRAVVYKTINGAKLRLHVFEPDGHTPADRRPAAVFFFGGGWTGGTPQQFFPQCKYLASRGMLAASAEYRVKNRHGITPYECVADGKSAIRWVRAHATKLGVDPDRIAGGGGSAGGHVAACTGVIEGLEEKGEDAAVSSRPNALVLFNPAVVLDFEEWKKRGIPAERLEKIRQRFQGRDPKGVSPCHHVKAGAPPTLVLHGRADTTVPFATAERFAEAMKKAGNRCQLVGYDGQGHGFFNLGRGDAFFQTLREADKFLASLDYLKGPNTVDQFKQSLTKP